MSGRVIYLLFIFSLVEYVWAIFVQSLFDAFVTFFLSVKLPREVFGIRNKLRKSVLFFFPLFVVCTSWEADDLLIGLNVQFRSRSISRLVDFTLFFRWHCLDSETTRNAASIVPGVFIFLFSCVFYVYTGVALARSTAVQLNPCWKLDSARKRGEFTRAF